ncbi:hypothetical protein N752_04575 [Desulforamulus aquiferis]|nr:hypothetical protein N752_04575 [Desulforamulus aquiferis]
MFTIAFYGFTFFIISLTRNSNDKIKSSCCSKTATFYFQRRGDYIIKLV